MGWLIDPGDRSVFICMPDRTFQIIDEPSTILPVPEFARSIELTVEQLFNWIKKNTEVDRWLETRILPILASSDRQTPFDKFTDMCMEVNQFFNGGQNSCLWAVLVMERSSDDLFHTQIRGAFLRWIEAIASVLIAAGLDENLANQRGEDAIVAIQGASILCHGLRDFGAFDRVLKQLPEQLCQGVGLARRHRELERQELAESAELYVEDEELQQLTDAAIANWPK